MNFTLSRFPQRLNPEGEWQEYGMENSFLLPAARADIYKRKGEWAKARLAYETALNLAVSPADKRFLKKKIIEMSSLF